jgi:protein MpaA
MYGAQANPRLIVVGASAESRPIDAYRLGNGTTSVVIVGGIHGASELNASAVVWQLLDYYAGNQGAIPAALSLVFVPQANPDALADGGRDLADGVDPNRNWPTADWEPDTYGPGGAPVPGGGGDYPLSEPETTALAELIDQLRPIAVISFHSAGGIAMGGDTSRRTGVLSAYAESSGYPAGDFLAYPVTGDFAQWCDEQDIPVVEVELSDHIESELDRNLAGVQAVLNLIAYGPPPPTPEPSESDDPSY